MSLPLNGPQRNRLQRLRKQAWGVSGCGDRAGGNDTAQLLNTVRLGTGSEGQACHEQKKEGDGQAETEGKRERKEERKDARRIS